MNELQMQNIGGIDYHLKDQYARDIIATSENGLDSQSNLPVASRPYVIGEYLIDQNRLYYEVIDTISTGDVLVVGTNIKRTTVSAEINKLKGNSAIMAIEIVAPIEDALLSTREYQEGDSLYWLNEHLSGLYEATMHIVVGDALVIGTNIKPAKKVAKSVKDINDEISDITGILGAKNLCPNNASTVTQSGVTYTVNADGSVKITGTATANSSLILGYTTLPKGKYKLTTEQANESVASQYLYIQERNNDTWGNVIGSSKDNSGEFTLDADTRVGCLIGCDNGRTGVTTVYPMCRPVTIIDESYVPHVPTNRELSSQISDIANKYAITTRYNVNLAVCDGISNVNAYLSTARNSIAAWMNNLNSNTLVLFERLNIGSISIPNIGTIIASKNIGIASSGRAVFCLPYISNGKMCMFEAIGLQHYYEINGTTFTDHGSEVPPSGTIISVGVCIFEKT